MCIESINSTLECESSFTSPWDDPPPLGMSHSSNWSIWALTSSLDISPSSHSQARGKEIAKLDMVKTPLIMSLGVLVLDVESAYGLWGGH